MEYLKKRKKEFFFYQRKCKTRITCRIYWFVYAMLYRCTIMVIVMAIYVPNGMQVHRHINTFFICLHIYIHAHIQLMADRLIVFFCWHFVVVRFFFLPSKLHSWPKRNFMSCFFVLLLTMSFNSIFNFFSY